jgi:hypothetical protein
LHTSVLRHRRPDVRDRDQVLTGLQDRETLKAVIEEELKSQENSTAR